MKTQQWNWLKDALSEIAVDKESEYDHVGLESISEKVLDSDSAPTPEWTGAKEKQPMTASTHTGKDIPKRDSQRAADALRHAEYLCEYNGRDKAYLRKNGKPYTEPHHLIPISKYRESAYERSGTEMPGSHQEVSLIQGKDRKSRS